MASMDGTENATADGTALIAGIDVAEIIHLIERVETAEALLRRSHSVLINCLADRPSDLYREARVRVLRRLVDDISAALALDVGFGERPASSG